MWNARNVLSFLSESDFLSNPDSYGTMRFSYNKNLSEQIWQDVKSGVELLLVKESGQE